MSPSELLPLAEHWLLRRTDVHSQHSHRHVVMDILLADRQLRTRADLIGRPHGAHHDDPEFGGERLAAARVLHEGHRRVDVHLSRVCVRRAPGVRRRERSQ